MRTRKPRPLRRAAAIAGWIGLALLLGGAEPCNPPPCTPDTDGDGVCDAQDACPGFDDAIDADLDGQPDACDSCPVDGLDDQDGDGTCDSDDACPMDAPDDADGNEVCDVVDAYPLDGVLRLNHVQVRGTHNSYHVEEVLPVHPSHEYTHQPLDVQLGEQGVRAFEIDVHNEASGVRVYHIAGVDNVSTCDLFTDCLEVIKGWSDAHRHHLPIFVWIELKDSTGGTAFTDLDAFDDLIRGVFPPEQLLTPDDVRGAHPDLRTALTTDGWPTLGEVRGQVMFCLLSGGSYRDTYTYGHTTLAGRAMFAGAGSSQLDQPWVAVAKFNDPASGSHLAAHAANVITAANVCAADEDDASCWLELDAGKANGVTMLKDDIPAPVPDRDYFLDLPDGNPARCNEVTAPPGCTAADLEDLAP